MKHESDHKSVRNIIEYVWNENWLKRLSYLADIFKAVNEMSLKSEKKGIPKFYVHDNVDTMVKKHKRWPWKLVENSFDAFHVFLQSNEIKVNKETVNIIKAYIEALASAPR